MFFLIEKSISPHNTGVPWTYYPRHAAQQLAQPDRCLSECDVEAWWLQLVERTTRRHAQPLGDRICRSRRKPRCPNGSPSPIWLRPERCGAAEHCGPVRRQAPGDLTATCRSLGMLAETNGERLNGRDPASRSSAAF